MGHDSFSGRRCLVNADAISDYEIWKKCSRTISRKVRLAKVEFGCIDVAGKSGSQLSLLKDRVKFV